MSQKYSKELQSMAKELGKPSKKHSALYDLYDQSEFCLYPSINEPTVPPMRKKHALAPISIF